MALNSLVSSMLRVRRRWLIAAALLLLLGILLHARQGDKNTPEENTASITRGALEESVTAQGTLEPKEYVDVGAQVSGQLLRVAVAIGDVVKKGQLLAEIDPRVYLANEEAAIAKLKSLRAQLAQQKAQTLLNKKIYERNRALLKDKAVAQEELDESAANYKVAVASENSLNAQIEEQQSALEAVQANLSYTKIYAPMDGTVTSQPVRAGQTLNTMQTAPTIVQVANLDVMTARAQVAEADVSRVTPGMQVYFTTLGSGERRWTGTVRQVEPTPELVNDVVLYNALVDADNKDRALMMDMSAQMFFVIGKVENALLIPTQALVKPVPEQNNAQGKAYLVRVKTGKKTQEKIVHIGMMTRTQAELRDGLNEGDHVVLPNASSAASSTAGGGRAMMGPRL